jgi:hypothetical protein
LTSEGLEHNVAQIVRLEQRDRLALSAARVAAAK